MHDEAVQAAQGNPSCGSRCLYLAWLLCAQTELVDDEAVAPPVPTGIQKLSASLQVFADFMALDSDLLSVATEAGVGEMPPELSPRELEEWSAHLPDQEKTKLLVRLVAGDDPHLPLELRRRCRLSQAAGGAARGKNELSETPQPSPTGRHGSMICVERAA